MEKSRKTTTKSDPSTGDQLSKRRAETWPGRVRRSLVAFRSPDAGRMPKPGPVVCAEALPPGRGRAGPGRAGQLPAARPGFGTRPAARLRRTRPGRASACDRRPGSGTRPDFGAHDRARFRHAACSADPPWTDRTLSSFSSISPTITLLRSLNASSPHLASGSLLLPPFTHRSALNSVEKNVDRHLRFPN